MAVSVGTLLSALHDKSLVDVVCDILSVASSEIVGTDMYDEIYGDGGVCGELIADVVSVSVVEDPAMALSSCCSFRVSSKVTTLLLGFVICNEFVTVLEYIK